MVVSAEDRVVASAAAAATVLSARSDARVVTVEGGHMLFVDAGARLVGEVMAFLDDVG